MVFLALGASFGLTLLLARVFRALRPIRTRRSGCILVTGTFYNHGWFLSHARPLALCGADEVLFVTDEPRDAPQRIRFVCPPRWASRLLGRAGSKLLWMWAAGLRCRPDVCMGYHLFPGGLATLIVARLLGSPACYQMTGGPIEIIGGGAFNENRFMKGLGRPSAFLEKLALKVVREFELVIVRGNQTKRFLEEKGVNRAVEIITGSIIPPAVEPDSERRIDMIFVGRLTRIKQPEQFVQVLARVAKLYPSVRGVMVGGGPEREKLERLAFELGVRDNVALFGQRDDVNELLADAKVYLLTSRSEGLSIALAEAMGCGAVPVVADVGELGDLVESGVNGFLIPPNDVEAYASRVVELLTDESKRARFSKVAREESLSLAGVDAVAKRWNRCLSPWLKANGAGTGKSESCTTIP